MQSQIVTVLSNEEDLQKMNEEIMQNKISILKCPRFWRLDEKQMNLRTNYFEGYPKYDIEWSYL